MGPTWPNLGPRCAPNSLTLLNIGPTKANIGVTYAPQTQVGRRPAVRRKPSNPGAGQEARGMPGGPSVVTEGYRRSHRLLPSPKRGDHRFTDAPVIYSVSCVCVRYKNTVFYRVYCAYRSTTWGKGRNAKMLCFSRVVSVMRAGRTGLIDILWVEALQTTYIA